MSKDRATADAQALFDRGHHSIETRDFPEAVECFSRVIALRPDVAAGYRARAKAYLELGRRSDALNDLDRAIRLKPDDPALFAERAEVLFRQKAYGPAIADCDKVLALDAGWVAVLGRRAECHAALGDTLAARADFAAAIEGDPENAPHYLVARAHLALDLEEYAACVADCDAALRLAPDQPDALRVRGLARRELGDLDAAESDLTESLRLDPESALTLLARATVRLDRKQYAAALADCDGVIRLAPGNARAFSLGGLCRQGLDDLPGAAADFSEAVRLAPTTPLFYNLRAGVLYRQGQYARAVQDHLEALKRDPRSASTFNQMAWIWATAPDPDVRNGRQAKECATRACELSEWQEPGFLDTLAAACAECGEFDDAVRWQEKAVGLANEADEFRARAELYRQGKPYRTPK